MVRFLFVISLMLLITTPLQAGKRNPAREEARKGKKPPKIKLPARRESNQPTQKQTKLNKEIEAVKNTLNPLLQWAPFVGFTAGYITRTAFWCMFKEETVKEAPLHTQTTILSALTGAALGVILQKNNADYAAVCQWEKLKSKRTKLQDKSKELDDHHTAMLTFLETHTLLFPHTEKLRSRLAIKSQQKETVMECAQQ